MEATEHRSIPQHLLQFPQELDGSRGRDVGPVEERETAAVDRQGVVGEGVICETGAQRSTGHLSRSKTLPLLHAAGCKCSLTWMFLTASVKKKGLPVGRVYIKRYTLV